MTYRLLAAALMLAAAALPAAAQTQVQEPWARGTVAEQKSTGVFARITSTAGGRLVSASTPLAGRVEIHEMAMDGNVMRMRELPNGLALPAGKPVDLKPGGHHLMLMELRQTLKEGDTVPLTLVVEDSAGKKTPVELKVPVRALGAPAHKH